MSEFVKTRVRRISLPRFRACCRPILGIRRSFLRRAARGGNIAFIELRDKITLTMDCYHGLRDVLGEDAVHIRGDRNLPERRKRWKPAEPAA